MTQEEFNDYLQKHKVSKVEPNEFGHTIYFDNETWVEVGSDYDSITYEYHYKGEPEKSLDKESARNLIHTITYLDQREINTDIAQP